MNGNMIQYAIMPGDRIFNWETESEKLLEIYGG